MALSNNTRNWFDYHEDYPLLTSGANLTPPIPIGTPALAWHSAFWIPNSYYEMPFDEAARQLSRDNWVLNVEQFILHLYDNLVAAGHNGQELTSSWQQLPDKQPRLYLLQNWYPADRRERSPANTGSFKTWHQSVHLTFPWQTIPVDFGIDMHTEFVAFSAVLKMAE